MMRLYLRCTLLLAMLLGSAAVLANPYEKTLANGLHVIVKEDHRAPTVVQMVWYRAGAIDEVDGTSGLAHMLEHMMFKGTKKVQACRSGWRARQCLYQPRLHRLLPAGTETRSARDDGTGS